MLPSDPTIPHKAYDPDAMNPGIRELLRQQEFEEEPDHARAMAVLHRSHGKVYENGEWVFEVPYSQANWEGDGV